MVSDDVQSVVDSVIRERLGQNIDVISVVATRDEDYNGDEILRVTVVVDSPSSAFDAKRLSSLLRFLRPRLAEHKEKAFPLVSFMSKADAAMSAS